jgi:glycine/D-amino acid oxidase-like deaminating enzyme
MPHFDFLVIGQGLAGSLLGYRLEQRGRTVCWIDAPAQTSATSVAAGIINPITGRRFVKSWLVETLLPAARTLYRELEDELGISIYHERPLLRTLFNRGDENDWMARTGDPAYAEFMRESRRDAGPFASVTQPAFAYGPVRHTAQVDIGELVRSLDERWAAAGLLRREVFDYAQLTVTDSGVRYGDLTADRLVFSEGWRSRFNPYFSYLPFGGNKGEVLIVRIPGLSVTGMLKHRVFLVPLGEERYWVGSTSENAFTGDEPTERARGYLADRLDELLTVPYEILAHRSAVRPTVRDRRPFLGNHPQWPRLAIFNGLGTKGASLAPYWSAVLADYLTAERPESLPASVDIARYAPEPPPG